MTFVISYIYLVKYLKLHKIRLRIIKKSLKKQLLKALFKHTFVFASILIIFYVILIYFVFFSDKNYKNDYFDFDNDIYNLKSVSNIDLNTYFSSSKSKIVQPINIIIITKKDISEIMNDLNWEENKIILKDDITLKEYIKMYKNKTLPITNLEFM
jgi:hypothetical protein